MKESISKSEFKLLKEIRLYRSTCLAGGTTSGKNEVSGYHGSKGKCCGLRVVTFCGVVGDDQCFGRSYCLHLHHNSADQNINVSGNIEEARFEFHVK
jgi:hypothetical protein